VICIRRDPAECIRSLARILPQAPLEPLVYLLVDELHELIASTKPMVCDYAHLWQQKTAREIWDYATDGAQLPEAHLRKMLTLHVTQCESLIQSAPSKRNASLLATRFPSNALGSHTACR
jgi:hypothetical protein